MSRVRPANADPDLDLAPVIAAARAGERWALTVLFRQYQPLLLRYLRGQEPIAADDLAGEVWLAVARRLASFVGDERGFRCWLFTIARCRLMEHRRTGARRRTVPFPPERFDLPLHAGDAGDPAVIVVEGLSAQDAVDLLVSELTPDQAEVVLLRVVAGLSVGEVARLMSRSPGSVRVLQHRALKRLAAQWSAKVVTE